MKSVSAIIAAILILMVVVAMSALAYMFSSSIITSTTAKGEQQLGNVTTRMGGCLKIENFNAKSKNITLRNCGYNPLGDFKFYADSYLISSYTGTLNPGELLNLNLNMPQGDHTVYVTSNYAESSPKEVYVASPCEVYIYNSGLTYVIDKNNAYYCLAENVNMNSNNAINFNSGVQNTTLDCLGYSINGGGSFDGVYLAGSETKGNTIKDCFVNDYNYAIHINDSSTNNTVINSVAKLSYVGLHFEGNANNNIAINNVFDYNDVGIAACGAYYNTFIDNTANHNSDIGFWCNGCSYSNITGRSIWNNTNHDYYYPSSGGSETVNFINTNFTGQRKIYFSDSVTWFVYNNESTGNVWLKTNPFSATTIRRKLFSWSQNTVSWNDTSISACTTTGYNITGLAYPASYNVYNNYALLPGSPFTSGTNGEINFTIYLPTDEEHNITVQKV